VVDIDNEQTLSHSPDNVEHLVLTITDDQRGWSDPEGIKSQLENIFQSIDQARLEKRDVLIHCVSGKSRSATVLTAYLMWACRQSFQSVLQFIQMKRWQASPCPEFRKILSEEFQPLLEREGIIQ
jgi:protein-tyrosine phosphatase